jgi:uncharacterized protein with von Willebrand factor type A (vWA) domain
MNMTRRQFLRGGIAAASVGSVASLGLFDDLFQKIFAWFTGRKKSTVIADALASAEGRAALAQSMVEPIRRSLEYQAVGRKLLMVDELPQGTLARYERDVAAIAQELIDAA